MSVTFEIKAMGDRGMLLELESNAAVHAVATAAREHFDDQLLEVVPGHRTLLLVFDPDDPISDLSVLESAALATGQALRQDAGEPSQAKALTIRVDYDGGDLTRIAQTLGVDRERVIELHCAPLYTVAFMGFAPGFPYLVGLPRELELSRLEVPRVQVPKGSVAIAGGYCGIYPRSSPGGWNLLGRTEVVLFDPGREPPALLAPGDHVRFQPA